MIRQGAILVLALATGPAAEPAAPIALTSEQLARCHAEGGCILVTIRELERALSRAASDGAKAERAKGFKERT